MSDQAIPAEAVTTRQELGEYLGQSMRAEYLERVEGRVTRQVSTSLKTYLVELHLHGQSPEAALNATPFRDVSPTREPSLWLLHDAEGGAYFLDLLNERFPLVHTITYTNHSDRAIEQFVRDTRGADRCWLPSTFLLGQDLGRVIGFRFFHQRVTEGLADSEESQALAKDLGRPHAPAFRLKIAEYANAGEDLAALRQSGLFGFRSAIQSLAWRRTRPDTPGQFIHDEIWSQGKVSAYGTSWESHLANVLTVRDRYANVLDTLETNYALRTAEHLTGTPIDIRLEGAPISDPAAFLDDLLRGRAPFRLWGIPTPISDGHVAADAIDLHTGHRVSLDVTRDRIRLYLRTETCGNVFMRLVANVEQYLSSEVATTADDLLLGTNDAEVS